MLCFFGHLCYYGQVIRSLRPPPNPDSAPFWQACAERVFLLPRCRTCGLLFWYPRMACPDCGSPDVDFAPCPGTGTVWSHTEVHISFFGPQWASDVPYTVLLVDLDDGPRLLSRLAPESTPVATGDRVSLTFVDTDNGPPAMLCS